MFRGPGSFTLNAQVSKALTLSTRSTNIQLRLRADASNLLNRPIWGAPNLNIDSVNFGLDHDCSGNSQHPTRSAHRF